MRNTAAGEEPTTDCELFDDHEEAMDCACGRPACRRRITGQDWERLDLRIRYRGYSSWYLDRKMQSG